MSNLSMRLRNLVGMGMPIEVAELPVLTEGADELDRLEAIEVAAKEVTEHYSASSFADFDDLVHGRR